MNSKNKFFIIIAVIVILLLVGFFYFLLTYDFKKDRDYQGSEQNVIKESEETNKIPVNNNEQNEEEEDSNQAIKHESKEEEKPDFNSGNGLSEAGLKNMASSFAERFGSYSNHSNYGNFDDLEIFMTDNMKEWAKEFVDKEKEKETRNDYYGITTKAIATNVKEFDKEKGTAEVVVSTKRKESEGKRSNSETYDQKLTLNFIDQNGIWKVDKASWEK